jgi:hypothetical protein
MQNDFRHVGQASCLSLLQPKEHHRQAGCLSYVSRARLSRRVALVALFGLLLAVQTASAQWTNQTITLKPGWNSVFLEVQPEPAECDTLFAGLAVESAWMWNRRFSSVQYIQDPSELVPGQPDWLTWLPSSGQSSPAVNLFILQGGYSYLIKLATNAAQVNWTVRGRPLVRATEWLSDSLNMVGFAVDGASPPTFQVYFAGAAAQAGKPAYRLNTSGGWTQVNAATERPNRGEAYWVQTTGPSTYSGPLAVTLEQGRGLDYGRILVEQTLLIRNASPSNRLVTLKQVPSMTPPDMSFPALAGAVPLSYYLASYPTNVGFVPLPAQLTNMLAPGDEWSIRLAVRRPDMAAYTPPTGVTNALYQSLLQISDGVGTRVLVPVTAQGLQNYGGGGVKDLWGVAPKGTAGETNRRAGLWVGSAVVRKVNQPASLGAPKNTPTPTASEFQVRLLLHVDNAGQARLLQKVLLMWSNGVARVNDQGYREVVLPGRYVLVTDDALIPRFSGSALRDGEPVARRFSSSAFAFRHPISLTQTNAGEFGGDGSAFTALVSIGYDDPVNPFKHSYHPDHNNLDETFTRKLPDGVESFTVNRQITFQFTAADPDKLTLAGWGDTQLGGVYRETITGLHKNTLYVEGSFRLQQASRVGVLNDGF